MRDDEAGAAAGRRCPICGVPTRHEFRPFCSRRCADVDLGRWLRGVYRVPSDEAPAAEAPGDDDGGSGGGC
ncbi:MAG: DNA gyrase inhibitor YacG [Kiloniellaceae bacterium]